MTSIYVSHVRDGLAELASEEMQRQLWLPSLDPRIGSFEEAVSQTYDDSGLEDVLDKPLAVEEIGAEAVRLLQELGAVLASVDRTLGVEDLIGSPEMRTVRSLAKAALEALPS